MREKNGTPGLLPLSKVTLLTSHRITKKTWSTKAFVRGFSKTLHSGFLILTYWNYNNAVVFLDNDIKSGEEFYVPINVNQGAEQAVILVPLVAQLYREIYGLVARTNQQLSYYSTEFRSVRKQSRIFDSLLEIYVLVNGHTSLKSISNFMSLETLQGRKATPAQYFYCC